jgi:hypothetical protein
LTLHGHEPSLKSLGKYKTLESINGKTISYENQILTWLHKCKNESVEKPFLRESIIQFIKLINKMTNNIDVQERLEIRDLISNSENNMESAKLLVENFKHVKWHTVDDFWKEMCQELIRLELEIVEQPTSVNITNTTHFESYKKSFIDNNDYGIKVKTKGGLVIFIWNGTGDDWIYWGIKKNDFTTNWKKKTEKYLETNSGFFEEDINMLWRYFELEYDENIQLIDFSYKGTFDLINSNYRKSIIQNKLIPEIKNFIDNVG